MKVPFKFLPHEILNKPKPAPSIRIHPATPHEFFILKPTKRPLTPPKPVTTIRAYLWSQNPHPQTPKKKKKATHPPPAAETHKINTHCPKTQQPPVVKPIITSTTAMSHAAAAFPVVAPPQSSTPNLASPLPSNLLSLLRFRFLSLVSVVFFFHKSVLWVRVFQFRVFHLTFF